MLSWTREINSKQWKTFIAAFLGWTLDAMDLLLYVFAFKFIAAVEETLEWEDFLPSLPPEMHGRDTLIVLDRKSD